jgi:hypothetical protein
MTLSITSLRVRKLCITTLSIMIVGITTLSIAIKMCKEACIVLIDAYVVTIKSSVIMVSVIYKL